jgi:hypothetical protein
VRCPWIVIEDERPVLSTIKIVTGNVRLSEMAARAWELDTVSNINNKICAADCQSAASYRDPRAMLIKMIANTKPAVTARRESPS